jgi:hypothetical protein
MLKTSALSVTPFYDLQKQGEIIEQFAQDNLNTAKTEEFLCPSISSQGGPAGGSVHLYPAYSQIPRLLVARTLFTGKINRRECL